MLFLFAAEKSIKKLKNEMGDIMTDTSVLKNKVMKGLFWKLSERVGVQGVQFLIQVILARLLLPEDFGNVAIINVFILIANVLIQYGFSTALIQKENADHLDYSSTFYINLVISTGMYTILYIAAPYLADFYNDALLCSLLRVQALILFLGAFSSIQNAVLSKNMDFKKSFIINFGGCITQGIIGIGLAVSGVGIWSLVLAQLANSMVMVILGFIVVKWHPTFHFSVIRIKTLFAFGKNILVASLLETICNNVYALTIGKVYSKQSLGYYNRGQSIPSMLTNTIDGSIQGVLFPALSTCQNDVKKMKALMRRSIRVSCYLVFPVMAGIIAVSNPLIRLLLTDKWLPAVPFLRMSCLAMAFYPIHTANLQAINASGRSDIYLKLETIKKILLIVVLIITLNFSIYSVMWGSVFCSILSIAINSWPNKKLFDYSLKEQVKDIIPALVLSCVMGVSVFILGTVLEFTVFINLVILVICGFSIYIIGSMLFNIEEFQYIIQSVMSLKKK